MPDAEIPQPPQPPSIGRALKPHASQVVGVGVLVLIVVLALLGVFGETHGRATAEGPPFRLEVTYPERFRYKTIDSVDVTVTNTGDEAVSSLTVRFDRAYIDAFSTTTFTPSLTRVTSDAYEVDVSDLAPGETQPVSVEVQAEAYWGHPGFVEAATPEADVRVDVHSFVYP